MTQYSFTSRVIPLFGLSLFVAAIAAFIGTYFIGYIASPAVILTLSIVEFVLLFASIFARRQRQAGGMLLFAFVFVSGLLISPVISIYVANGAGILIAEALGLTALVFGALSFYAYTTKQNFNRLGGFLFASLIGIIIASIVSIFIQNSMLLLIINIASILIFSGYVLYDMGRILNEFRDDEIYPAVLSLYIDFLNLFLNILELLGYSRRRD